MLSRYTIYRRRPHDAGPLPQGVRQDTRHRTSHILRPTQAMVETYLAEPTTQAFTQFSSAYHKLLADRWKQDQAAFENLAELARHEDVYLGCSCPTKKNPNVRHCHTWMALEFMAKKFSDVEVIFPATNT